MSLTGAAFLWLMVGIAVAAFAATVVLQPRVAGAGPRPVLARISLLLSLNLVVVFALLVGFNDEFAFFADWDDLHGALFGGSAAVSTYAAGGATAVPVPAPVRATSKTATSYTVHGPISGLSGKVLISLPPGYDLPQNQHRTYPVLETFHGYPGGPDQWYTSMALRRQLDSAADRHLLADVITVSPSWELPAGVDTECVNGKAPVETWLTQDVPTWAKRTLRVRADRGSWATIGLSAGGWCAEMAAVLHPQTYSAALSFSGYTRPDFSPGYRPFSMRSANGMRYDLLALVRRDPPPLQLWVQSSESDKISYPSTRELLKDARAPLSVTALIQKHTGHRLSVWAPLLPDALLWLGSHVPGFAAP